MKNNPSHPLACQCRAQLGEHCGCTQGMSGLDTPLEKTIAIAGLIATVLGIFVNNRILGRKSNPANIFSSKRNYQVQKEGQSLASSKSGTLSQIIKELNSYEIEDSGEIIASGIQGMWVVIVAGKKSNKEHLIVIQAFGREDAEDLVDYLQNHYFKSTKSNPFFKKKKTFDISKLDEKLDEALEKFEREKKKEKNQISDTKIFTIHKVISKNKDKESLKREETTLRKLKWLLARHEEWEFLKSFKYKNAYLLFVYPKDFEKEKPLQYIVEESELKKLKISPEEFIEYLLYSGDV